MDYFSSRRTVRKYAERHIDDSLLNDILSDATHCPTTGNMQLYSVVISRRRDIIQRLAPAHFNQPAIIGCDVVLTVCADFNRFVKWCDFRDANPGYDNFQSFITAFLDATIFAQQICTIAEIHGLGCCYLGTTTYNAPQIADVLNLPKRVVPVVTLTLGYPDETPEDCGRLPLDAVVHNETYHDYSVDDINRLYSEKESRLDSRRFVEDNGKQTLAQVFTDVRYTREANEHFSDIFLNFIRSKGFEFD